MSQTIGDSGIMHARQ